MSDPRLDPPLSMPTYAVRAPLARWLVDEAERWLCGQHFELLQRERMVVTLDE